MMILRNNFWGRKWEWKSVRSHHPFICSRRGVGYIWYFGTVWSVQKIISIGYEYLDVANLTSALNEIIGINER